MNITYRLCQPDEINKDFLHGYKRFYHTTEMFYLKNQELHTTTVDFIDDWDELKLHEIAKYLKVCVLRGGVVAVAMDQDRVVGFANIEPYLYFNEYINMPYIHVSNDYHNQGIGKILFYMLEKSAKQLGAKKLYISTHPAIPAQRFYESVGTVLANKIIPELYEKEPADIHREKELI